MTEPLAITFDVACSRDHAFALWTEHTSTWWPASHTVSAEPGVEIIIEPRVGGRIYERTGQGNEHDWGRLTTWEPPGRIAYLWHLRQDRADATHVEITFTADGPGRTVVSIRHDGWDRLGARGNERRRQNESGWSGLLQHFVAAAN